MLMRRILAVVGACVLGLAAFAPGASAAAPGTADPGLSAADRAAPSAGMPPAAKPAPGAAPRGPNPFLALLPDPSKADYAGWSAWLKQRAPQLAKARLQQKQSSPRALVSTPIVVDEDEPAGGLGSNDKPASAEIVAGFGTAAGKNPAMRVLGGLSLESVTADEVDPNTEDDGAIPLAGDTGIGTLHDGIVTAGVIGDGPHGEAGTGTGDFDFYRIEANEGERITVETDTPTGPLDTMVVLYDAAGDLLARNDDVAFPDLDSKLTYQVTTGGTYYAVVVGYNTIPADPTDPASGDGSGSEGPYTVTITSAGADRDFFAIKLRKGDVLGASVKGAATYLTVFDTVPREVHGSDQDASALYPMISPLIGGGNAVTDYVASRAGWHYVGIGTGDGRYDATVEAYRPALEGRAPTQTLFLDFDGARVNTAVFDGPGVVQLSPLSAFVPLWGLPRVDEDAVIDAVVARVTENVKQDMVASGLNNRFRLRVLNSRDHADPFGQPNVSRIIVGGTIEESGVDTIGISQSIDPGNFETEETALVLLDVLSAPTGGASLNTYLKANSDRIAFVGDALGNVISHEAGHFFGNWHTDELNANANLEDQGGNPALMFGVGPDRVGGTADDVDVDFGDDTFHPDEGFVGTEDTLGRIAAAVTS
jgi:hypothetical protein